MLPLLLNRLESQEVVVYTYAAVALDRILSMRVSGSTALMYVSLPLSFIASALSSNRFSSVDVQPFASQLLNVLLVKIGVQPNPERTAENDFLMRCTWVFYAVYDVPDKCSQVLRESS